MSVTITITTTSTRMHGLGDRGASWRSAQADMGELGVPVKWQFPDAPIAAVTCNDGYEMTSWFDIEVLYVLHRPPVVLYFPTACMWLTGRSSALFQEIPVAPGAKDYPGSVSRSRCGKKYAGNLRARV